MKQVMKNPAQRLISLMLCIAMLVGFVPSCLPVLANAADASIPLVDSATVQLPTYATTSGKESEKFVYDCGNGVTGNGATSTMRIVTGTNASEFNQYCNLLAADHSQVWTNSFASATGSNNLFRKYRAEDGSYSVYAYFLPSYSEARIIIDTNHDTVEGFKYEAGPAVTTPKLVMWGLSMSPNGYHMETSTGLNTNRENNGALTIIRMKDNSLFIQDGGILAQMSEAAVAELLAFCRELTGTTGTNKKMVINAWMLTHAHDDHFQGFTRFINITHEHFDLKNIIYNIDIERTDPTRDIRDAMRIISGHYPDVCYYKPHTGEFFNIAGVKFDVLLTHEDRIVPDASGRISVVEGDTGTFREGTYVKEKDSAGNYVVTDKSDYNDTSTALRVTFENDVISTLYGDMNLMDTFLRNIHASSSLRADIMQVPHHGFDPHVELVQMSASKIYLYTQHKQAIYGPQGDITKLDLFGTYRNETSTGRMRGNFVDMFPGMNVAKGDTPNVNYKVYFQGNESAIIDINNNLNVETRKAMNYEYTGWTLESLTDDETLGITPSGSSTTVGPVSTSNNRFELVGVTDSNKTSGNYIGEIKQDDKFVLLSNDGRYVMSFDAISYGTSSYPAHAGVSLTRDDSGKSANTFAIANNGAKMYIDHSNRDNTLWVLRQFKEVNGGTAVANGNRIHHIFYSNFVSTKDNLIYDGIELQKGKAGERGNFWYYTGNEPAFLFFDYSNVKKPFQKATVAYDSSNPSRKLFYLEAMDDGTYIFYYKVSDNDFRVIVCDEYGNWGVRQYANNVADAYPVSQMKTDVEKLKIRLYRYTESTTKKQVALKGYTNYDVDLGTELDTILDGIRNNITVYDYNTNHHIPCNDATAKKGYYTIDLSKVNKDASGTYDVYINYHNDDGSSTRVATLKVTVMGTVSSKEGYVSQKAYSSVPVHVTADSLAAPTFQYGGKTIDLTVGMLYDESGKNVNTSTPGVYSNLTVRYGAAVITKGFTLHVAEGTLAVDVPVYNEPGSVRVGKKSTTSDAEFSSTGVANIQLSATGKSYDKPVDLIIVMDLSSSMLYTSSSNKEVSGPKYNYDGTANTTTYVADQWQNTRLYALESSLLNMIDTLKEKDADVRIALVDFGDLDHYDFTDAVVDKNYRNYPYLDANSNGSGDNRREPSNHLNYILGRDDYLWADSAGQPYCSQPFYLDKNKYTAKVEPRVYTGSHNVSAEAFQSIYELNMLGNGTTKDPGTNSIVDYMNKQNGKLLGTNYDVGLEYAYRLAYARQQANEAAGVDREIACIFMSDGAAMQYNYFSGRANTEAWSQYLIGETDEILTNYADSYGWSWADYENDTIHPDMKRLLSEMHQRLAYGNLDNSATKNSSGHYKTCGCAYKTATEDGFFACLQRVTNNTNAYWKTVFEILYYNTNGDSDDINWGGDYVTKHFDTADHDYAGAWQRYALITSFRRPKFVDKDKDRVGDYAYQTSSPYYYFYNTEGKNWWAEAIKGDPDKVYPVINRFATTNTAAKTPSNWVTGYYNGEVANNFESTAAQGNTTKYLDENGNLVSLALEGKQYVSGFKGLGLELFTIGFAMADDNRISKEEATKVLDNVATGTNYHLEASDQDELTDVFNKIVTDVSSSATQAYFVDKMGPEFDLSTERQVTHINGEVITVNSNPTIQIKEYTLDANGNRTGAYTVLETITFEGGKVAKSDKVYTSLAADDTNYSYPDIWDDETGLITGKRVIFNTNKDRAVDLTLDSSGRKYSLAPETFFWIIGIVPETELVLEYQVYLTGSADGARVGSKAQYATNTEAVLHYIDYLGNDAQKDTVSPEFTWVTDVVVIDYGIPVKIGAPYYTSGNKIVAVRDGADLPGVVNGSLQSMNFGSQVDGKFGGVKVVNGELIYTPGTMSITSSDPFVYVVEANGEYYYTTLYVVPATTVYYEDSFVKLDVVDGPGNIITGEKWDTVGSTVDKVQDEDRPKVDENDALGNLDMDSIYGFDTNYKNFAQYSLGSAAKITVSAGRAGKASFDFWGTGFDVISLSSCDTGVIVVKVTDAEGNYVVNYMVDTYYGYKFENGKWIVDASANNNALYQVPVIKVDLNRVVKTEDDAATTDVDETTYFGYGHYKVEIVASYAPLFDHGKCKCGTEVDKQLIKCGACANSSECSCTANTCAECFSYDFYLDAIRIYDPANDGVNDNVIKDAYIADGEYLPTYEELRNQLITKQEFDSLGENEKDGIIFIDGKGELGTGDAAANQTMKPGVADYANYGPNNEVYLAANQAVAFKLNSVANLNQVHLALKSVGGSAKVTIYGVDANGAKTYVVVNGQTILNDATINSATDLYYNITNLVGKTVVIRNSGESGMLSITNIKSTYTAQGTANQMLMTVDSISADMALASLEGEKDPIVSEGVIVPNAATLTFEDEILLNIYFQLSGFEADLADLGLITYTADGNTILDTIPGATYVDGQYVVTTKPIAAKNLGDTVYFRIYAKQADGSCVYSKLLSYSPKTYAMNILNKSENVAMKALVVAMLNYGAEAQKYFGYKTEALVNADLTADQKALVADYSADMLAPVGKVDSAKIGAFAANGGFGKKYPTVSLEGAFAINYYIQTSYPVDGELTLYYWSAEDYANAEVLTAENATGIVEGNTISGIAAKDLDSTIYVAAVYESNGVRYCTGILPYSVGAFCAAMADNSALAQAIAVYGSYAKAYFG